MNQDIKRWSETDLMVAFHEIISKPVLSEQDEMDMARINDVFRDRERLAAP